MPKQSEREKYLGAWRQCDIDVNIVYCDSFATGTDLGGRIVTYWARVFADALIICTLRKFMLSQRTGLHANCTLAGPT